MAPKTGTVCPNPENCPYGETIESIDRRLANIEGMLEERTRAAAAMRWAVGILVTVTGIVVGAVVGLAGKVHVK